MFKTDARFEVFTAARLEGLRCGVGSGFKYLMIGSNGGLL
jgi:hypothetical protein